MRGVTAAAQEQLRRLDANLSRSSGFGLRQTDRQNALLQRGLHLVDRHFRRQAQRSAEGPGGPLLAMEGRLLPLGRRAFDLDGQFIADNGEVHLFVFHAGG